MQLYISFNRALQVVAYPSGLHLQRRAEQNSAELNKLTLIVSVSNNSDHIQTTRLKSFVKKTNLFTAGISGLCQNKEEITPFSVFLAPLEAFPKEWPSLLANFLGGCPSSSLVGASFLFGVASTSAESAASAVCF